MTRWRDMAELGWAAVMIPENFDGLGLEFADMVALHTEFGRAGFCEPLSVTMMTGLILSGGENNHLAKSVIPDILAGDKMLTLAWQAQTGAIDASDVKITATPIQSGWEITGTAQFVQHLVTSQAMIVAAQTPDGLGLFWVDNAPAPHKIIRQSDGTHIAEFHFQGHGIPNSAVISVGQNAPRLLEHALNAARLASAAELLGVMEQMLECTLDHLRTREQFGRAIGSFQALQHRAVDLYIQIELSRSAIDRAVTSLDQNAPFDKCQRDVSAAKARCSAAARLIAKECIQMHGAIGYTQEYDTSLFINRALQLSTFLGNAGTHRKFWAQSMSAGGTK